MSITEQKMDIDECTRDIGKRALATVIKQEKNCNIFEKNIYKKSSNPEMYRWVVYQVIGQLIIDRKQIKPILKGVKDGKVGWDNHVYDETRERLNEHYDYLVTPFEIVDGVVQCPKCKSHKTWSVQKQTRGCDEPMTTFSKCIGTVKKPDRDGVMVDVICGHEFVYSG